MQVEGYSLTHTKKNRKKRMDGERYKKSLDIVVSSYYAGKIGSPDLCAMAPLKPWRYRIDAQKPRLRCVPAPLRLTL